MGKSAGVTLVEPVEERVIRVLTSLGVRACAAQGLLTGTRGLRDELADENECAGEADERE